MGGKVPELIRAICDHSFFRNNIGFSTNRRQSDNVAAKLLLLEFRGTLVETKKIHLDRFVEEGLQAEAQSSEFGQAKERVLNILKNMTAVFAQKDPLLRSQGPITVYYWLVREIQETRLPSLRQFLVEFDDKRKANRKASRIDAGSADTELLNYDLLDRSTNDQSSLQGRFEILRRRLLSWQQS